VKTFIGILAGTLLTRWLKRNDSIQMEDIIVATMIFSD
jgi:hypothetical protein